jgi:hypothetical protein
MALARLVSVRAHHDHSCSWPCTNTRVAGLVLWTANSQTTDEVLERITERCRSITHLDRAAPSPALVASGSPLKPRLTI